MARPGKKPSALDREAAEAIALQGLTFLAEDAARMLRFLKLTGLELDEVRARAGTPELSLAVLEHLAGRQIPAARICRQPRSCSRKRRPCHRPARRGAPMTARMQEEVPLRVGIDLGGTKIAGAVLGRGGRPLAEHRMPAPRHDYGATVRAIGRDGARARGKRRQPRRERQQHRRRHSGLGGAGERAGAERQLHVAQRPAVPARPRGALWAARSGSPTMPTALPCRRPWMAPARAREAFSASSSARAAAAVSCVDGTSSTVRAASAANGATTRCRGRAPTSTPARKCWCGRVGCIETWVSGPGLEADHATGDGRAGSAPKEIAARAAAGDVAAQATLDRHAGRLARGLAHVDQHLRPGRDRAGRRSLQAHPLLSRCCQGLRRRTSSPSPRISSSSRRCGEMPVACAAPRGCGNDLDAHFCSHLLGGWKTISLRTPLMANSP